MPGFNSMWTMNYQMFKLDLEKAERFSSVQSLNPVWLFATPQRQRNQRSNCQHPLDHWKRKRVPEKHLFLLSWLRQSLWLCGSKHYGKFLKRWEYQTTWPASRENCMQVKKQQLEWDVEQQTGSKLGKEYVKAVYCHPAYLTHMQSTSCKMPE